MVGHRRTSFLLHARGLEHHSNGVKNVNSAINIVLASGRIGRPKCGYGTITGQANGQGGREHGQKADQLPGGRDLGNPEHRAHIAGLGDGRRGHAAARRGRLRALQQDRPRRDQGACSASASTRSSRCRTTTSSGRRSRSSSSSSRSTSS
jgi:anaerobic selenocysteine-containing dehydrogenase